MPYVLERTTPTLLIQEREETCPATGARHAVVTATRRHPACYGVYVGHPISGIRVGRILEMQDRVRRLFAEANAASVQQVATYFPMRTTHLRPDEVGDNTYDPSAALFADTRAFTLQNRNDALCNADGVLLNFDLRDDEGSYRLSKGIPFDWGWARAAGKPVVSVIPPGNPNWTPGLEAASAVVARDLADGVAALNALLPHAAARGGHWQAAVEIFDFGGCPAALDTIALLAEADARKHTLGGRAIVTVMPEGDRNPSWHGQVRQVSDWVVASRAEASTVACQLLGL